MRGSKIMPVLLGLCVLLCACLRQEDRVFITDDLEWCLHGIGKSSLKLRGYGLVATGNLGLSFCDVSVRFYDRDNSNIRGIVNLLTKKVSDDYFCSRSISTESSLTNNVVEYSADSVMGHYGRACRAEFDKDLLRLRERLHMRKVN